MKIFHTLTQLREWKKTLTTPLALVPTMGCLHQGHLSLVKHAQEYTSTVLMSIFVNPTQFNQADDFTLYPRTLESDLQKAKSAGCTACFVPTVETMYPPGSQTRVSIGTLGEYLCGAARPGHFDGVCTVVSQLFNMTQCEYAIFGEKDFQQLAIIRQMVQDLHFPVHIIGSPTYREDDGLAMSSRNLRLTSVHRQRAPLLYQGLQVGYSMWEKGCRDIDLLLETVQNHFPQEGKIDYLMICDSLTLQPIDRQWKEGCKEGWEEGILALAYFFDDVRLIDHIRLEAS